MKDNQVCVFFAGCDAGEVPKASVLRDYPSRAACAPVALLDMVKLLEGGGGGDRE